MSDIPVAQLDPNCQWNDNLDQIAHGTLSGLTNLDPNNPEEHAGIIYQRTSDGKYCNSLPTDQAGRDQFALKADLQPGYKIAGIYHTHPGTDDLSLNYSPQDLQMADKLKVPSYILFLKDMSMKKYVPGVTKTHTLFDDSGEGGLGDMPKKVSRGDPLTINDDQARKNAVVQAYNKTSK